MAFERIQNSLININDSYFSIQNVFKKYEIPFPQPISQFDLSESFFYASHHHRISPIDFLSNQGVVHLVDELFLFLEDAEFYPLNLSLKVDIDLAIENHFESLLSNSNELKYVSVLINNSNERFKVFFKNFKSQSIVKLWDEEWLPHSLKEIVVTRIITNNGLLIKSTFSKFRCLSYLATYSGCAIALFLIKSNFELTTDELYSILLACSDSSKILLLPYLKSFSNRLTKPQLYHIVEKTIDTADKESLLKFSQDEAFFYLSLFDFEDIERDFLKLILSSKYLNFVAPNYAERIHSLCSIRLLALKEGDDEKYLFKSFKIVFTRFCHNELDSQKAYLEKILFELDFFYPEKNLKMNFIYKILLKDNPFYHSKLLQALSLFRLSTSNFDELIEWLKTNNCILLLEHLEHLMKDDEALDFIFNLIPTIDNSILFSKVLLKYTHAIEDERYIYAVRSLIEINPQDLQLIHRLDLQRNTKLLSYAKELWLCDQINQNKLFSKPFWEMDYFSDLRVLAPILILPNAIRFHPTLNTIESFSKDILHDNYLNSLDVALKSIEERSKECANLLNRYFKERQIKETIEYYQKQVRDLQLLSLKIPSSYSAGMNEKFISLQHLKEGLSSQGITTLHDLENSLIDIKWILTIYLFLLTKNEEDKIIKKCSLKGFADISQHILELMKFPQSSTFFHELLFQRILKGFPLYHEYSRNSPISSLYSLVTFSESNEKNEYIFNLINQKRKSIEKFFKESKVFLEKALKNWRSLNQNIQATCDVLSYLLKKIALEIDSWRPLKEDYQRNLSLLTILIAEGDNFALNDIMLDSKKISVRATEILNEYFSVPDDMHQALSKIILEWKDSYLLLSFMKQHRNNPLMDLFKKWFNYVLVGPKALELFRFHSQENGYYFSQFNDSLVESYKKDLIIDLKPIEKIWKKKIEKLQLHATQFVEECLYALTFKSPSLEKIKIDSVNYSIPTLRNSSFEELIKKAKKIFNNDTHVQNDWVSYFKLLKLTKQFLLAIESDKYKKAYKELQRIQQTFGQTRQHLLNHGLSASTIEDILHKIVYLS